MKLLGQVDLHVRGERVLRQPNILDRIKRALGGEPDLSTSQIRTSLEAAAVVDAARSALRTLGATDALSLVIDDQVIYQDRDGRTDDLGDLYLAFHEHATVFGGSFSMLRLAVEHLEAGLHLVVEIVAQGLHPDHEAAARVVVSGRIRDFEPRPGEDAEGYRHRLEPIVANPAIYEVHRRQFESFVSRLSDTLRAALPEARVEIRDATARVERPTRIPQTYRAPPPPSSPRYDPHDVYYPNPLGMVLSAMMWSSLFTMATTPDVVVVNERGDELGSPDEVGPEVGDDADSYSNGLGEDGGEGGWGDGGDGGGDFGGDFGGGD